MHTSISWSCAAVIAAAFLTTACAQEAKTTETTPPDSTVTTTTTTVDTTQYWTALPTLTDRIAADLRLTDTVVVRKVRTVYRTRAHRLSAAERQYAADTTGRYAALRAANDEADRELRTALNDPARYRTYEQNRAAYYEGTPYTAPVVTAPPAPRGPAEVSREVGKDGEVKIKYADGSKMKIGQDGDTKVKYADGHKVKNGDDGHKVKR
ncbi:MAG: hypothetical protein H7330_04575 [Hymenobacteraceae bacterium]|nr:hypothetical protein [Hymenobacteraceae bacterium]